MGLGDRASENNAQESNFPDHQAYDNGYSSFDNSEVRSDSVTLSWTAPKTNADGTAITDDLAGYIVYYGQESGSYTDTVDIGNYTSAFISNLTSGTWCFSVTAYDYAGNESDVSEEVCKTLS
ncbi:MAG: fibronectin type III domain-containing protein [Nitrospiraceae bacterium]|nr:MAG: fibronectin type III domain-containing protein [Nitrospiraceae bacterium]